LEGAPKSYDAIKNVAWSVRLAARVNNLATKMDAPVAKLIAQVRLLCLMKAIYNADGLSETSTMRLHTAVADAVSEIFLRTELTDPLREAVMIQFIKGTGHDEKALEYVERVYEQCPDFASQLEAYMDKKPWL
jgi:hypothetical protein